MYVFNVIKVQWMTTITISGLYPNPKIIIKLHLCAGCDRNRRAASERLLQTHSTFSMSEWRSMAHTTVRCFWLKSYTACHAWDLFRQCFCSPSMQDNQPSETRHLCSFHQIFCHPTAQIWTQLTTKIRI